MDFFFFASLREKKASPRLAVTGAREKYYTHAVGPKAKNIMKLKEYYWFLWDKRRRRRRRKERALALHNPQFYYEEKWAPMILHYFSFRPRSPSSSLEGFFFSCLRWPRLWESISCRLMKAEAEQKEKMK
jgi:hypothetical protein